MHIHLFTVSSYFLYIKEQRNMSNEYCPNSRVGNFRQKIPRKTEITKQMVCSDGIPAVPQNRKLSEFRRREISSEFHTVEQK